MEDYLDDRFIISDEVRKMTKEERFAEIARLEKEAALEKEKKLKEKKSLDKAV